MVTARVAGVVDSDGTLMRPVPEMLVLSAVRQLPKLSLRVRYSGWPK
jgi:hypothetical protein